MRILLIAPHPFYQERGTPIAVDLLCRVLSAMNVSIDIATFHEGNDRNYPNVIIHRISSRSWLKSIGPGFSIKKVICDVFLFFQVKNLIKLNNYDLIHAVEEAAFIALYYHWRRGIPFVYDMDSSMASQLIEKMPWLTPIKPFFTYMEAKPIKQAIHVMPMCQQMVEQAENIGAQSITLLKDVSLVDAQESPSEDCIDLRQHYSIDSPILMYIGNLEHYQGIDLLLNSFSLALKQNSGVNLVIIGGNEKHITHYRRQCESLNISDNVIFTGPMQIGLLNSLMSQANFLVSPRTKGGNTPMKIYTYMDSNRAILATNLDTHTQVLSEESAFLCEPNKESMAQGILALLKNKQRTLEVAKRAKEQVRREHSFEHYQDTLTKAYNGIRSQLQKSG